MAAYAALLSLARSLHQILDLEQYDIPSHKDILVSLHEKVDFIITFLEDYSDNYGRRLGCVGTGIRKDSYEAQDFMDSYLSSLLRTDDDPSSSEAGCDKLSLDQDLNMAFERINCIWEEAMKIKNCNAAEDILPNDTYSVPVHYSSTVKNNANNMVVGFDDDLNAIKERLYEDSAKLQIIPIVGMGGIGKTTLARRAYEDSLLAQYFDVCAWMTVSVEYQRRDILSLLLQSLKKSTTDNNEQSDRSEAELAKLVYQNLMGRRYLIVIDDIWSTKAWDDVNMLFPDDGSGSRILLTTRLSDVAMHTGSSSSSLHQMSFLSEDLSWKLFQKKIFGQESCPFHLVEIGQKIARSCGGLPLTIVVVAGLLLSTDNTTKEEYWENISENVSSTEPAIELQCSKIVCLSYDHLPLRLKPCFLYIAAFPEESRIDATRLIKLWDAEGFLKPSDQSKCLEDVGEQYLLDLVNRSLISVSEKWLDGKPQTVGIHDLLREICITKAEEEGLLRNVSSKMNTQIETIENSNRRLSVHYKQTFEEQLKLDPSIRSVLIFNKGHFFSELSLCWRLLNILDAPGVTWLNFSNAISKFVNLRYISFVLNKISCPHGFPASISKLPNLETLYVHAVDITGDTDFSDLQVPYEILEMPKLRHLIIGCPFLLSFPCNIEINYESNLQTLGTVLDLILTEEAVKILANLKKLKFTLTMYLGNLDVYNLNHLFRLQNLEELQVSVFFPNPSIIWNYDFPISLKKLTLCGVPLPWENMTIIGSLPNLQVLEMVAIDVTEVSEWKPIEGQFLQLKCFNSSLDYLVRWEVEKEHFPSLESLILLEADWIDEIPCGVGEIDSLQLIELRHCSESLVNSAKQIQVQQHENGNDAFQVRVID